MKFIDKLYFASIDHFINWRKHTKEYVFAIVIALILRSFIGIYQIPTGSMIPTLKIKDVLIGNRFHFGYKLPFTQGLEGFRLPGIRSIRIGDVVIFRSPPENNYYILRSKISTPEQLNHLNIVNSEVASFQPPLNTINNLTNYIFLNNNSLYHQSSEPLFPINNNIFEHSTTNDFYPFWVNLYVNKDYYLKNVEQLEKKLSITKTTKFFKKNLDTYHQDYYKGILFHLVSGPLSVISILANSVLNTPFFTLYHTIIQSKDKVSTKRLDATSIFERDYFSYTSQKPNKSVLGFDFCLFYPNNYVDVRKQYVKRVIAKEGDKVEIINRVVFINDQSLEQTFMSKDSEDENYSLYQEKQVTADGKSFSYPVRFNTEDYYHKVSLWNSGYIDQKHNGTNKSSLPYFNADVWPYAPEINGLYKNNFGPITVPKNHYFLMGDNRDNSIDSRFFGTVPKHYIIGKPMFIFLPFTVKRMLIR